MKKAKIGIVIITAVTPAGVERNAVNTSYVNAVLKTGGTPLMLPVTTDPEVLDSYVEACDGFIFSGGIDINPLEYGENPSKLVGPSCQKLDRYQIDFMKKVIASGKPFIAICRGIQVLNVACGGTLYQDVREFSADVMKHMQEGTRGDVSHLVTITPNTTLSSLFGEKIATNSYHHESLKVLGKGLKCTAVADDGIVEAVELENYDFGMGIQWHPEVMFEVSDSMRPLFASLIEKALK